MNRAASIFKVFHFNPKGASIIAVIAIMLILAVMGAALVSLVTTGSDVSVNQLQSEQALQIQQRVRG